MTKSYWLQQSYITSPGAGKILGSNSGHLLWAVPGHRHRAVFHIGPWAKNHPSPSVGILFRHGAQTLIPASGHHPNFEERPLGPGPGPGPPSVTSRSTNFRDRLLDIVCRQGLDPFFCCFIFYPLQSFFQKVKFQNIYIWPQAPARFPYFCTHTYPAQLEKQYLGVYREPVGTNNYVLRLTFVVIQLPSLPLTDSCGFCL